MSTLNEKRFLCVCDKVFEVYSVTVTNNNPLMCYVNGELVEVGKSDDNYKVEISGSNDLNVSFTMPNDELGKYPTMRRLTYTKPREIFLGENTRKGTEHFHIGTCLDFNNEILHVVKKKNAVGVVGRGTTALWRGPICYELPVKVKSVTGSPQIFTKFIGYVCVTVAEFKDSKASFVGVAVKSPEDEHDFVIGMKISANRAIAASHRGFVPGGGVFKEKQPTPDLKKHKDKILEFMQESSKCPFYNSYF